MTVIYLERHLKLAELNILNYKLSCNHRSDCAAAVSGTSRGIGEGMGVQSMPAFYYKTLFQPPMKNFSEQAATHGRKAFT
jgi:hypothetical protein